jgi:FdhD protein
MAEEFNSEINQPPLDPQDLPTRRVSVRRITADSSETLDDDVAAEEPLEIRIVFGPADQRRSKSLSITMRTPGNDRELAAGFLRSENVISHDRQIEKMDFAGPSPDHGSHGNTLVVELSPDVTFSADQLQRHFYMTSSCGVCGKASIEAVMQQGFCPVPQTIAVSADLVRSLPEKLRHNQAVFESTGGLHAAGLFDHQGQLLAIREDVGRHNAVDKLVGAQMSDLQDDFPAAGRMMVVSGRASFELVQKALTASFEMLIAVGAPSSLAIELATEFNLTLVGFASTNRINVYSGFERIT